MLDIRQFATTFFMYLHPSHVLLQQTKKFKTFWKCEPNMMIMMPIADYNQSNMAASYLIPRNITILVSLLPASASNSIRIRLKEVDILMFCACQMIRNMITVKQRLAWSNQRKWLNKWWTSLRKKWVAHKSYLRLNGEFHFKLLSRWLAFRITFDICRRRSQ